METSQYRAGTTRSLQCASDRNVNAGFSLLEVLFAITILAIGLSAMAALVAQSLAGTERARYLALATTLASEKLEDLRRWSPVAPEVAAGGSLATDSPAATNEDFYDNVDLSNTNGQIAESTATSTGYSNIVHQATGEVDVTPSSSTPVSSGSGTLVFHRRWLIESPPTVGGVTLTGSRRVTVLVTLTNQSVSPPVSFQMSMVRP